MEVLYVTKTSPVTGGGGGEKRARKVTAGLADRGHGVTILTGKTDPDLSKWDQIDECDVRHVRCIPDLLFRFPTVSFYATRYLFALTSLPVLAWLLRQHDVDVVVENMTPYPSLSVVLAKLTGTPIVAVQHEFYDRSSFRTYDPVTATIQLLVQNLLRVAHYDRVIVPTSHVAERLDEYGVEGSTLAVVPNGVDVDAYDLPDAERTRTNFVTVGRLSKRKGQRTVLKAFAIVHEEVPEARLHVVGQGPAEEDLRMLADRLGIEGSVTFHGFVDDQRKIELLNESGVFVFASRQEGFGLVLLEAMAAGLPIVATELPVYRSIFGDDEHDQLVNSRDAQRFAESLVELLENTDRYETTKTANERTSREFSWDSTCDCTGHILEEVVT